MQGLRGLVRNTKKDYCGNRANAIELANKIEEYYHLKGHTKVRCWVEPELTGGFKNLYGVRSNIIFNISDLQIN